MSTKKRKQQRIFVDFDGVLTSYSNGWQGYGVCDDLPVPGALEWLSSVLQAYHVTILSGRAATWRGRRCIRRWLKKHGGHLWADYIPVSLQLLPRVGLRHVKVTSQKKGDYILYVDDRGWSFHGRQFPTLPELALFKPWHRLKR